MTGRDAFLELYGGQEPPPNSHWGVDISYWQNGGWERWIEWAEYVCIRLSFGGSGDDGRQHQHVQSARDFNYRGLLGAYHYHSPSAGMRNADNFIAHYREFPEGTFQYVMYDFEEGDSWANIQAICESIKAAIGKTPLLYLSKSIADKAGVQAVYVPWYAHYGNGNYTAFSPTADWAEWKAPYTPNGYAGYDKPYIWQFGSSSNTLGSLDLNWTNDLSLLGGSGALQEEDVTESDLARIQEFVNTAANNLTGVITSQLEAIKVDHGNDATDGVLAVTRRHVDMMFQHFGFTVEHPGFDDFVPRVTETFDQLSSKLDSAGSLPMQIELLRQQLAELVSNMVKVADHFTFSDPKGKDLAPVIKALQDVITQLQAK